nr:PREDICTED: E3 ubiquitin-protein ligase RNF125 [Latimeria chalumnae]|eukprot:XP_014348793.1 PREDICTED: E3 ubiquitin-protein ligase RNF125 [Latimeria chalumnae]
MEQTLKNSVATNSAAEANKLAEGYDCPVCLDVFHKPVRTEGCQHMFCNYCLLESTKTKKCCPLCRESITGKVEPASDVEKQMETTYGSCRECSLQVLLSEMRSHLATHGLCFPTDRPGPGWLSDSVTTAEIPIEIPQHTEAAGRRFPPA